MKKYIRSIEDLPELPLELHTLHGELFESEIEPIITILPTKSENIVKDNTPEKSDLRCANRSSYTTTKYYAQVIYPKLICWPNHFNSDLKLLNEKQPKNEEKVNSCFQDIPEMKYYKLSNYRESAQGILCSVHYGPFSAIIYSETQCGSACGQPPLKWDLSIPSLPELETVKWYGTWNDIPVQIYPSLTVLLNSLVKVGSVYSCCPGFKKCPGSTTCIRESVKCPGQDF